MDQSLTQFNKAFTGETLKSERLRTLILAVIFALAALLLCVVPRLFTFFFIDAFFKSVKGLPLHLWIGLLLFAFCAYECLVYIRYRLFTSESGRWVTVFQYLNTTVETSFPGIVLLIISPLVSTPAIILSPVVYLYFFFIALSTLRLSFKLSIFTGAIAAVEYFLIYWFYFKPLGSPSVDPFILAPGQHLVKSLLFLIIGIAIGFVTLEIRKRVFVSIRFVEEKNKFLKDYAIVLEKQVRERTEDLNRTLLEVEAANNKLTASIKYAQRIQYSLLPSKEAISRQFPDNFVIWNPRDIVGGDIYFAEKYHAGFLLAVFDCTGHGVPGALMTMISSSAIREIMNGASFLDPASMMASLNRFVKTSLHQYSEKTPSNDGLDASICYLNTDKRTLTFAGARQSLVYFIQDRLYLLKGDRHSIGYKNSNLDFEFTNHTIPLDQTTTIYLYTDGIVDQLGGNKRLAFGNKRFRALLGEAMKKPLREQKEFILSSFNTYRGNNEIQDDITVIGFRG
ncbi:serine/threonine-protein phosphatase [bacterium]|nr:serine/threonine-protein phosphatase [bacterium]